MLAADPYPVLDVTRWDRSGDEAMGTKEKFWCADPDGERHLFKFARPGTGEGWAEKIAAELGRSLGVPCAEVELALCDGRPGSLSRSFVVEGRHVLVHGNELLQSIDTSYPMHQLRGVSPHTVDAVLQLLESVGPGPAPVPSLATGADVFVGYLLLDALITNGDRHHENWGVLQLSGGARDLAPSYDHASSLGRELTDGERQGRLATSDFQYQPTAYHRRARSAFFAIGGQKPLHPIAAFARAAKLRPAAGKLWLARLATLGEDELDVLLQRAPSSAMSGPANHFARKLIELSRNQLLSLVP